MLAIVNSIVHVGLEGKTVRVEVDVSSGLPVLERLLLKLYIRYVHVWTQN